MEITLETTLLASPDLALGRVGPAGISLNGQQLVDDAQFFRAAVATVWSRENAGVNLQFNVKHLLTGEKLAGVFVLTHWANLPKTGLLTCVCGPTGDQQTVYLEAAVLESAQIVEQLGTSITVRYTIRGGQFTTDVPPEVPGESEASEEFIVMRRGKAAIANGASSKAIVFSSPLSAVPVVNFNISRPTGGATIAGTLREDTVTANGFTVDLDAATPNGDYVLHYSAIE